ncbi:MAG: fibronectin type III domain-containing protein [Actinomycetota bacterium]|nr:fibronectin type III domain-containing protein [Actinomycetota bacterium]
MSAQSRRPLRNIRTGIAVALIALTGTYVLADPVDDGVRANGTVAYTEQAAAVQLRSSGSVSIGTYDGGYVDFAITTPTSSSEDLSYGTSETASTTAGEVTIVGTSIYLGNGTTADNIGSVDSTYNGQDGERLRINFVNSFSNASFEEATLTGWTKLESQVVLGSTTIAGYVAIDRRNYSGMGCANDYDDGVYTGSNANMSRKSVTVTSASASDGTKSLLLDMYATAGSGGGWVIHGPAVYSDQFQATSGDEISFDWKAIGGGDDYSVFGYIVNVANGSQTTVLDAYEQRDGLKTNWTTASVEIPASGNYRFVFVAGSHNADCGSQGDAKLYIDNVQVFGSKVDQTVAEKVAALVAYSNDSNNPAATRSVAFTAVNGAGTTTTTETITVNITAVDDPPALTDPATITYLNTSADDTFSVASGTLSDGFSDPDGDTPTYSLPNGISETVTINSVNYDAAEAGTFGTLRLNSSTGQYVMVPNEGALDPEQVSQSETFAVRATAAGVDADASLTLAVSVPASAPTAPTGLTANPSGEGGVALSWDTPGWLGGSVVASYTIQKSSNGSTDWTTATTSATTSATVAGLTAPATWYFRVTATNATGTSAVSSTTSSNTYGLPTTPSDLTATPGDESATITWTVLANDGGAAISDYEYQVDGDSWVTAGTDGTEEITGLTNGTAHTIGLRGVNAAGDGATSTISVTPRTIPGTPGSLTSANVAADGFDISFSAATDGGASISRYEYRVDSGSGFGAWTTTGGGSPSTVTLSQLADDTSHDIELRAVNAAGTGPEGAITVQTPARTLTVTAGSTSILVDGTSTLSHTVDAGAGEVTYTVTGPCSIAGTTVTATGAGTCTVTGTIATDSTSVTDVTYSSVSAAETITVSLESQAAVTVTGAPSSLAYGASASLASSGGSGAGAVTFDDGTSTACEVEPSTGDVTMTAGTGTCEITATKAATYRYSSTTSAAVTITPGPAAVTVTGPTPASIVYGAEIPTLDPVYSGLVGDDTSVTGVTCSTDYDPTDADNNVVGSYTTTCSGASDPNYTASYETGSLVVGRKQLRVTAPSQTIEYGTEVPSSFTPTITGFVYDQTVDDITPPTCSTTYTAASNVGDYSTTCTAASATNYSFTYTAGVLTVTPIGQSTFSINVRTSDDEEFGDDDIAVYGQTIIISTSGGSGTGAVTHSVGASDACTVATVDGVTTLSIIAGVGTCTLTTSKAGDDNFDSITATRTFEIGPATLRRPSAPTVVAVNPTTIRVGIPVVTGATSHTVRLTADGVAVASVTVDADVTSVTFSDLDPNTTYAATVTAISGSDNWGDSLASASTETTTPEPQSATASIAVPDNTATPTLVTADDAPTISRQPGTAGATDINGQPLDIVVRSLLSDAAVASAVSTPPAERTPDQVVAIQTAARMLAEDFDDARPAGLAPMFAVVNTPTGVVIRGLVDGGDTDAINDTTKEQIRGDIPFENAIVLETQESTLVLAALDPTGEPVPLTAGGVLEIYGGTVATAAFGFEPGSSGEVVIFSTPRLIATFDTNDYGAFTGEFDLPPDLEPGEHTLVFTTESLTKSIGIRIPEPSRSLPSTGANTDGLLPWLVLIMATGALVWLISSGRHRQSFVRV